MGNVEWLKYDISDEESKNRENKGGKKYIEPDSTSTVIYIYSTTILLHKKLLSFYYVPGNREVNN